MVDRAVEAALEVAVVIKEARITGHGHKGNIRGKTGGAAVSEVALAVAGAAVKAVEAKEVVGEGVEACRGGVEIIITREEGFDLAADLDSVERVDPGEMVREVEGQRSG